MCCTASLGGWIWARRPSETRFRDASATTRRQPSSEVRRRRLRGDSKRHQQATAHLLLDLTRSASAGIGIHGRAPVSVFVCVPAPKCPGVRLFIPRPSSQRWQTRIWLSAQCHIGSNGPLARRPGDGIIYANYVTGLKPAFQLTYLHKEPESCLRCQRSEMRNLIINYVFNLRAL